MATNFGVDVHVLLRRNRDSFGDRGGQTSDVSSALVFDQTPVERMTFPLDSVKWYLFACQHLHDIGC